MRDLSEMGLCDPMRPGIVHRLDKGTSGVLVVAKTPEGFSNLSIQLAERLMERTYYGMVEGHVAEERGIVDARSDVRRALPTVMAVRSDGRAARTGYEVIARHRETARDDAVALTTRYWTSVLCALRRAARTALNAASRGAAVVAAREVA